MKAENKEKRRDEDETKQKKNIRKREEPREEAFILWWASWLPGSPLCVMADVDSQREEANFSSHITAQGQALMIGCLEGPQDPRCVCVLSGWIRVSKELMRETAQEYVVGVH